MKPPELWDDGQLKRKIKEFRQQERNWNFFYGAAGAIVIGLTAWHIIGLYLR